MNRYSVLNGKINERGISKSVISRTLGISPRTLRNKIAGTSDFTWTQTCIIQRTFFPDITKDELFKWIDENNEAS